MVNYLWIADHQFLSAVLPGTRCRSLVLSAAFAVLSLVPAGCGGSQEAFGAPTPTQRSQPVQSYALVGTLNGQPASGRMVLVYEGVAGANLLKFSVSAFVMAGLRGIGDAQYLTIGKRLTIDVDAQTASQEQVALSGSQKGVSVIGIFPVIADFTLSSEGYAITFSGTPN